MRTRIFIALLLCLALLAGCGAPLAFPTETPAAPEATPAPAETPQAAEPSPLPAEAEGAGRGFPFAALYEDTAYWCTQSGVFALTAGEKAKLFSETKGRLPVVLDGYLYIVEDETDTIENDVWPVPSNEVTASSLLRIPLAGGSAEKIYTAPANINGLAALEGRLYLSTSEGEGLQEAGGLFSIDAAGKDEQLLAEDCILLACAQEGYAYYMGVLEAHAALFRIPIAGGEAELLRDGAGWPTTPLAYKGDVYYVHMDLMSAEAENNLAIMRLREGKSEVLASGVSAHELLGIWGGKLYYYAVSEGEDAFPYPVVRLDLSTLERETVYEGEQAVAALSGTYAALRDHLPVVSDAEDASDAPALAFSLLPLAGGEAIVFSLEDAAEKPA